MKTHLGRRSSVLVGIMGSLLAAAAFAAAALVNATLEPAQITLGQSAQLTISRLGDSIDPVALPVVAGLDFRVVEQSRRIEVVHGASLTTTTFVVRITPQLAGTFIIPAITPKSQPLVLRVTADDAAGNLNVSGMSTAGIKMTPDGSAFLRLSVPKGEVYVGESVPIAIEMGIREGFVKSVNGLPTLTGGDFTFNNLSRQPERYEKLIDGKPFTLLTWRTVLAAIKPGTFSLSVETPLTVRITTRPQRESKLEDQLGDPFLQNIFGATISKDIKAESPPYELKVLALPTDGRPAGFSGAVGSFSIASELSSSVAAAGDPLTLRMRVTGSGNFDRVDSAMLDHFDQWKTYPPKSSFKSSDAIGYLGEKTFEQPIIASKPGAQILPGMAFSYFDPATHNYQTARSSPLSVTISPSLADSTLIAPPAKRILPGLRADHAASAPTADTLVPLYLRPRFLSIPSALGLLFAGGWLTLRRRTDSEIPKAVRRVLAKMEAAARAGDTGLFLDAARSALELIPAAHESEDEDVRRLFALADEAKYSGNEPAPLDFSRWTEVVSRRLMGETAS